MYQVSRLVRFTQAANTTGIPALVLPLMPKPDSSCGTCGAPGAPTTGQLPASFQLMGQPWHDAALMRTGYVLEQALRATGVFPPPPPLVCNTLPAKPVAAKAGKKAGKR
jgi:Asp-tRNA(Asn)/Glu-tRNA(Gln) amidotransferase A subunit family amidase